ncbi:MAG: hypothetical protein FWG77_00340 [Treponema sp.]|nr:hypothetical protein [Treponema sp.]
MNINLLDYGALALCFRIDGFRLIFGSITIFLWLITAVFSPGYFASHPKKLRRYIFFNLLTLLSTLGVFFSSDFRTTFLFFEIMSFSSYPLIIHDENPEALRAGETYLAIAIIGGLSILFGMLMIQNLLGTLEFTSLFMQTEIDRQDLYLPGVLMLIGFGAKAGMFPLHFWLPKAHPVAPAPASALLSGILIKTGIFGTAILSGSLFYGDYTWSMILLIPAVITMVLGALLALFSDDLKKIIACSSVSQMGLIFIGIAMQGLPIDGSNFAAGGVLLHILNHSLIKLSLFLAAGIVYMNLGELSLEKIRGFGRGKPLFLIIFLISALSISGLPLFSGYLSKTLLHESIVDAVYWYQNPLGLLGFTDIAFIFTGALTLAYMAKLFTVLFTGEGGKAAARPYIGPAPAFALGFTALIVLALGLFPSLMNSIAETGSGFFQGHGDPLRPDYFSAKNLQSALISVLIGAGIYLLVVRRIIRHSIRWPNVLDIENLLIRPGLKLIIQIACFCAAFLAALPSLPLRKPSPEEPARIGGFSLGLLLAGAGICIALIYVFINALWI